MTKFFKTIQNDSTQNLKLLELDELNNKTQKDKKINFMEEFEL